MKIKLFSIPNLLTLSNLVCGAVATVYSLVYNDLSVAFMLIILAAVFDFFDGFVARLLGESSPLGVQLDSLADDISFGLAPSAMLYALYMNHAEGLWIDERFGWVVFIFAAFAALRLAKFNIDDTQHAEFCGLPTPAATLLCGSIAVLAAAYDWAISRELILVLAVLTAFLMISPIRMFALKFKGFGWKGNELRYIFILIALASLIAFRLCALPIVMTLYIVISTVRWLMMPTENR